MLRRISRRGVLKAAAGSAAALALHPFVRGNDNAAKAVRVGIIGVGERGTMRLRQLLAQGTAVRVAAVCDLDARNLTRALDLVERTRGTRPAACFGDYQPLLRRDDLDAVLIATPPELHAAMSIEAMRAGKFVGVEVPAAFTIDECRALARVRRESNAGYMMLENHLYDRSVMRVQRMADAGALGELTYGAGSYLHETLGVMEPTRAIGPVCRWMGVNAAIAGGDRLVSLVAMSNLNHVLIKTAHGRLIELRHDASSSRTAVETSAAGRYSLQGTRGAFESSRGERMVYLEGRTSGGKWEELEKYAREFDHPRWRGAEMQAASAESSNADHFVIEDFLTAVRMGVSPIDVMDSVTWSAIRPLSAESLIGGSKPVDIPGFA